MAIAFDTEGLRSGDDLAKGFELIPAGNYHCQVDDAAEKESDYCVELKCSIVSPGPQCGRTFKERVNFKGSTPEKARGAREGAIRTACRLGLTTMAAYEADRAAGKPHLVEWEANAPGSQFICTVVETHFIGRDGDKVPKNEFKIFDIHDDAMRGKTHCDPSLLELVEGLNTDNPFSSNAPALKAQPVAAAATSNGATAKPDPYDI